MKTKGRAKTRRKKREVVFKMPEIEFNMEAIKEIKKRRKKFYQSILKQSKKRR